VGRDDPQTFSIGPDEEDFAGADALVAPELSSYACTLFAGRSMNIPYKFS
jgi:hypothetical protein